MNRTIVMALAAPILTFGTGINGCGGPKLLDFEVVVPPGASDIDDSLVVVLDEKGDTVVIPWNQFVGLNLKDYKTIAEVRADIRSP
ncbi:MAG: hypothetical protein ACR2PQ_08990 [Myxococcota bacterium]